VIIKIREGEMMNLTRLKLDKGGDKLFLLFVLDGLALTWARHLIGLAGASISYGRKFWLGREAEREWRVEELLFAVLMTVPVAAIFLSIVFTAGPPDEYGD
jgi:hypothetical protein